MIGIGRDAPHLSSETFDVIGLVEMSVMPNLLRFGTSNGLTHSPAVDEFPLHLFVEVGRDYLNKRLDECVSHYRLRGEVELRQTEGVLDDASSDSLNHSGRATTIVRQFLDLSDVAAVADSD